MDKAFLHPVPAVLKHFEVDQAQGLSEEQIERQREKYGRNALPEEPPTPLWKLVLEQFKDQLVIILLASAAVSFVLAVVEGGDDYTAFVDPVVILTILILNSVVGVSQESSAEKAIAALNEYSANEAKVLRNGTLTRIRAEDLVPGDIVDISVGDRIPADCRVLSILSNSFRVDQAILTGESESVGKGTAEIKDGDAVKQDQVNMLFSGTTVTIGHARAIVVLTGEATAIGDIHTSITAQISEPTPLKQKLNDFGDLLAKVISVICALVWIINVRNFNDEAHGGWVKGAMYYLKISVSLGVAAIPEGLAVVITTCLALGTRKMAARNAVVRSLPSVETLGSCSVICSDKTGTLTTNQMSVTKVVAFTASDGGLAELDLIAKGAEGELRTADGKNADHLKASAAIQRILDVSQVCNDAQINFDQKTNGFTMVGEPTEGALKVLVKRLGLPSGGLSNGASSSSVDAINAHYSNRLPRLCTYEFSRDRKSMSVLAGPKERPSLLVKGAPESIFERCTSVLSGSNTVPMTSRALDDLHKKVISLGNQGLRVIALAIVDNISSSAPVYSAKSTQDYLALEQNLTLVGLVGMLDPPRPEVASAIAKCRAAGIRVIVITGDNKQTAESICRQIGVFGPDEDLTGKSYTGREFDALEDWEQAHAAQTASLFSRTEPTHKSKLVDLLQASGAVVAMTGDGVNDAPALKKSDIGVAMGSGTDVAKLAADMVLTDDNFATIVVAVEEGRSIFANTQQFIRYLISSNIGEVVSIFLTAALGMPEALIPVQLLWVNLVTDGLPATALSFNPPDADIMRRTPRGRNERLVDGWLFFRYLVIGIYVGLATVGGYAWYFMFFNSGPKVSFHALSHFHSCQSLNDPTVLSCSIFNASSFESRTASTISLSILVVIEMLNAMNALSSSASLLTLPLWKNMMLVYAICLSLALHFALLYIPFLRGIFQITTLGWEEWKVVLWWSAPVIFIDEGLKAVERKWFLQSHDEVESEKVRGELRKRVKGE